MKKLNGLTLIELMITVAVLAVVSAIAVPAYRGYVGTSRQSECLKEIASIELAEREFFLERNTYFSGTSASGLGTASTNLYKPSQEIIDGVENCDYKVEVGSTGAISTSYKITATGKNKLPGTFTKVKGN